MSQQKKIRLGMIGCGIAARELHWPPLKEMSHQFRITAVCNHTETKAISYAEMLGEFYGSEIPWHLDYRELIARDDVDAVVVMLPVELNLTVCRAAAEAGKHILAEKPIAQDRKAAAEMLQLEKDYPGLVMMVAENFRYREVYRKMSELMKSGRIGTPYYLDWHCWQQMIPEISQYATTGWRVNHQFEGGFVTDGGVHNMAVLRDHFGELEFLGSAIAGVNPGIGKMDSLFTLFRTSGKEGVPPMTGHLNMGYSVNGVHDYTIRVLGSEGMLVVSWHKVHLFQNDKGKVREEPVESWDLPSSGGYREEYEDFYKALVHGSQPLSTFAEAARDLEAMLTAIEGAKK